MHVALSLCCILLVLPEDRAQKDQSPEAIALEQRTLNARRAMVRGEVEYHFVRRLHSVEAEEEFECRTVFDRERLRCDVNRSVAVPSDAAAANTSTVRRSVFTEDTFFCCYLDVNNPAGGSRVLYQYRSNRPYSLSVALHRTDPRLIGVVPADPLVLHSASLESFLAPTDRTNTCVERQELGGLETWRVQYDRGDGARIRMWIAPSQDYSVVRAAEEFDYDVGNLVSTIECENRKYGSPGVWFPHQVRYERFINEEWYYEVVLTVQQARFNQPVDEEVFTLTGMDIPEGTPVVDLPGPCKVRTIWDGRNIVPVRVGSPLPDLDAEGPEGEVPWRLLMSPVALALVALLAFFVRWRPRFMKDRPDA